jgi:Na+-transporting methylmalonyl-CoA/oxaloacetate decarboxylase gamma subunit
MYIFIAILAICWMLAGLFALVFRRGRRLRGALAVLASLVILVFAAGGIAEQEARAKGFASFAEEQDAKAAGFTTAASWNKHQADVRTQEKAAVEAAVEAERKAYEAELAEFQARGDENVRYARHCLSMFDGAPTRFMLEVQNRFADPNLFYHESTTTGPMDANGVNQVSMDFYIRQSDGSKVRGRAVGLIDNETCRMVNIDRVDFPLM